MWKESNLNYLVSSWLSSKIPGICVCSCVCVCGRAKRRREIRNERGRERYGKTQGKERGQVGRRERERESKREKEIKGIWKRIDGYKTKSLMRIIPINDIYVHVTKLLMDKNPKIIMTCYFKT